MFTTIDYRPPQIAIQPRNGTRRAPERFVDEHGQECVRVYLDRFGKRFAIVGASDYAAVIRAGVTGVWWLQDNGQGRQYVRSAITTGRGEYTNVQIARIILGSGPRAVVRYFNGDATDLRTMNLREFRGRAKRSAVVLAHNAAEHRAAG